jgi:hypothetical protein
MLDGIFQHDERLQAVVRQQGFSLEALPLNWGFGPRPTENKPSRLLICAKCTGNGSIPCSRSGQFEDPGCSGGN